MPPFQFFGGKSRVSDAVWSRLGDVDSYVEPFCGSCAVLMLRPAFDGERRETVNDADGFIANFWRALRADPDGVAAAADWPCNEADLMARHLWLVAKREVLTERLCADPDWFDAKIAGWWAWGQSWWIGSGWCSGDGPWTSDGAALIKRPHLSNDGQGVARQLPHLSDDGRGVNRKLPHLSDDGRGVARQLPHLSNDGQGVNRKLPHLGNDGQGVCAAYSEFLRSWLARLADRLRRVRVCCGDWSRVVTPSAAGYQPSYGGTVGIFLDPPYSAEADREMGVYATECGAVAHDVRVWCTEHDSDRRLRIALCGYEGEHNDIEARGWSVHEWRSTGMNTIAKSETRAQDNIHRERIWFSPHCLAPEETGLFGIPMPIGA